MQIDECHTSLCCDSLLRVTASTNIMLKKKRNRSANVLFPHLPAGTQAVLKRACVGGVLLATFVALLHAGPVFLLLTTFMAQIACLRELMAIAYDRYAVDFRHNTNYFLACALVYCWCDNLLAHYTPSADGSGDNGDVLQVIAAHYKFICFCMYLLGVVWFVLHLHRKHFRRQFSLLAWTTVVSLVVIAQSCLIARTVFQGVIWFIICVTTITCNDIMAYVCGMLFGRTPLIALSPKKTWEGFVGAGVFTVVISCAVSYALLDREHLICPVEFAHVADGGDGGGRSVAIVPQEGCVPDAIFRLHEYQLWGDWSLKTYPILVHTFWLAVFGSVVAPFGGFFASGFKRACGIKDFGGTLPGHGGIMDRFDCQLVMIVFLNVYIGTFVGRAQDERNATLLLFQRIANMSDAQQVQLLHLLRERLQHLIDVH